MRYCCFNFKYKCLRKWVAAVVSRLIVAQVAVQLKSSDRVAIAAVVLSALCLLYSPPHLT